MVKKITTIVIFLLLLASAVLNDRRAVEQHEIIPLYAIQSKEGTTIQPADLSEETKRIIGALGITNVHVFDLISRGKQPGMTRVWVEGFENGVKQEDLMNFSTDSSLESDKSQVIISYNVKTNEEKNERSLSITATIMDDRGSSSAAGDIVQSESFGNGMVIPLNTEKELLINRPVTVITMIEDDGSSLSYSEDEIGTYDETGKEPEHLKEYDRVYLFRMMLEKE